MSLLLIHTILYQRSKSIMVARLTKVDQESKKYGIYLSISQDALNNEIKSVALFLRQNILKHHEVNLPNPITVEAIQYGQCPDVPTELSLNSIGICSLAQKIKLVKEWNDTSSHQPKMTYTHVAVKPSKHMLLGMDLKSYVQRKFKKLLISSATVMNIILQIIKGIDAGILLPRKDVLMQKLARCN